MKIKSVLSQVKKIISNRKAFGFVNSGIKAIIAVVISGVLLGGTYATIGTVTWDLFLRYHNWWKGSALSMLYIAIVLVAIVLFIRKSGRIEL
ncbi:MAG: DUF6133 family protein [Archaeoglobaceae archaeon]|nr:DUF6133 family protein [Archaeoglobaceae archaeon]